MKFLSRERNSSSSFRERGSAVLISVARNLLFFVVADVVVLLKNDKTTQEIRFRKLISEVCLSIKYPLY